MEKQAVDKFHHGVGIVGRALATLAALVGFFTVIPLALWFAWMDDSSIAYSIAQSLFCLSFAWLLISLLQLQRNLRKLGLGPEAQTRLFSGQRPADPDELRIWQLGWQFMYALLAVSLSMSAMPAATWLSGK
jgi:hypothetical protein